MLIAFNATAVRHRSLPILYDTSLHLIVPLAQTAWFVTVGKTERQHPTALPAWT